MENPLISVIIPVFNCEKFVHLSLNSVIGQTFQDFEIVIVDDGSIDRTQELCLKFAGQYPEKVRCHHQENKGPSSARNAGIALSLGEYVAFLDADDYWDEQFLELMLNKLIDLRADIVVCDNYRLEYMNGSLKSEEIEKRSDELVQSSSLYKAFLKEDLIGGPARVLYKRTLLDEMEGYDERLSVTECWDFWIRFFQKEKRVSILRQPLYYYHVRDDGSNITRRASIWQGIYENYLIYVKFKRSILQDPELKRVYSELFWNCSLRLFHEKTNFHWILYLILLSQRLHFSIFKKTARLLDRKGKPL